MEPANEITVVMPCHRQKKRFLVEAIESVIRQTSKGWKLVISTTEESQEVQRIASRYLSEQVQLAVSQEGGLANQLNTALDLVKTDYYTVLLSDDRLPSDAIELWEVALSEFKDADLIYGSRRIIDAAGARIRSRFLSCLSVNRESFLTLVSPRHPMLVRTEKARSIGGYDRLTSRHGCDDLDFTWSMFDANATFHLFDDCVYEYRLHSDAERLTTAVPLDEQQDTLGRILKKHGVSDEQAASIVAEATAGYLVLDNIGLSSLKTDPPSTIPLEPPIPNSIGYKGPTPFISVIIPVYEDMKKLSHCLAALGRQLYPADRFEVIVVDNDGNSGPSAYEPLIEPWGKRARLLKQREPGSYAARNRGIEEARGELLAFTDADCLPTPYWLSEGAKKWSELPPDSIIGGQIPLLFTKYPPNTAELFDHLLLGFPQQSFAEKEHFAATANMLCGRGVFERAGLFNADYQSVGDYEWGRRAWSLGIALHYAPRAVVVHPARTSLRDLAVKVRRTAGGRRVLRKQQGQKRPLLSALRFEIKRYYEFRNKLKSTGATLPPRTRRKLHIALALLQALCVLENIRFAVGGTPVRR